MFDKLLLNRIQKQKIHNLQFGFIKDHGSIPATVTIKESINYYTERQSTVFAIFLDNEKAFDRIWQDGLLYKLWHTGIT